MEEELRRDALEYHRLPTPGKISITPTKSLANQRDLALAYSRARSTSRWTRPTPTSWSTPSRCSSPPSAASTSRTLDDIIAGADIFLGLSAGGVLKPAMVVRMAPRPLIFALANPDPEIRPEAAKEVRPHSIIATGVPTIRTRSTTRFAFPSSSAARWTSAPPSSTRR